MSHGGNNRRRSDDNDDSADGPPPPDGGWGWAVAWASFMIHIVTDGITYSFGMFVNEFLVYFGATKGATAWIASILVGVTYCSGPISSAFVNKYGCRPVTIAGALLAGFCMLISSWAQSVTILYFTIGIGTGLGFGLIYLPAIVSVTVYFEKYRSLATGIAVCGSGFGTFVFAPLTEYLMAEYGWRGAMMIISAIVFNCIIFGAFFRPLEYDEPPEPRKKSIQKIVENGYNLKQIIAKSDIHSSAHDLQERTPCLTVTNGDVAIQRPHSIGHFSLTRSLKLDKSAAAEKNGNIPHQKHGNGEAARLALSQPMLITSTASDGGPRTHFGSQHFRKNGPLHRRDVFYQGSLMNIPQYRSRSDLKATEETDLMERPHSSYSHRNDSNLCRCISDDTKDTVMEMLDFSLLKDPIFILFTLSNFCTSIGFNVPYVFLVSRAELLGITTKNASYLLSTIGIANTVGRIVLGYIADKPWVNRLWVYNVCLTTCGVATALSAFCMDFPSLVVYASVFGFTIGAYVGLTSVILVDLLGLDKLTNAFGLLLLFQGIASLVGPPAAGWLYDAFMSYDPGFYLAGLTIAASGVMLYFIPYLQRLQERKRNAAIEQHL